tara:strand:- start:10322 stop:11050 length:729 start_codon:yes stop_codon:yes gene_type:complete
MINKRKITTCFVADWFRVDRDSNETIVVIDILRATSVISTAFHYGIKSVIPVQDLNEAKTYIGKENHIVAAERDAKPIKGFAFGNSPFNYMNDKLAGNTLVLTTTNGTKALKMASNNRCITASFINFQAVLDYLLLQNNDVVLLCSGWKGLFNLEDTIFAGKLADKLMDNGFNHTNDSTLAARHIYKNIQHDLFTFLSNSSHRERLKSLNMEEDTRFCLSPTFYSDIVPVLRDGLLVGHCKT